MDLHLQDKVAVVTGGTSGIGLACVAKLLQEGARVAFCARGEDRLKSIYEKYANDYGQDRVFAHAFSVLDKQHVHDFAGAVQDKWGRCDILINNAGQGRVSTFSNTTDEDWREELDLKFFSQIHPIRAFEPMLRQSPSGAIVAVNSLLAYQPESHMVCTSAARAGVQNLLKSLSTELAPDIRVNSVLLGLIFSEQWQRRFDNRDNQNQSLDDWLAELAQKKNIPLGRLGHPDEVANAIVFLASPVASYMTGSQIEISGGLSRYI